jgi:hypothetical protein
VPMREDKAARPRGTAVTSGAQPNGVHGWDRSTGFPG